MEKKDGKIPTKIYTGGWHREERWKNTHGGLRWWVAEEEKIEKYPRKFTLMGSAGREDGKIPTEVYTRGSMGREDRNIPTEVYTGG